VLRAASTIVPLDDAEVSSEANPGTVLGRDYLRGLRAIGVNRLSMGVQSLHDPTLRVLGRIHSADEAYSSYVEAREAGFGNINLDFIFGLPGQDLAQWHQTLATIVGWEVDHFALYSLILEERTPLYAQVTAGRISVPDNDATAAMYEAAINILGEARYEHYEISNWARATAGATAGSAAEVRDEHARPLAPTLHPFQPAYCHHNLAYWHNRDYWAAGAGAHGHRFPQRYANILGVDDYIHAVGQGRRPIAETIELHNNDLCAETMFMGLRLSDGVCADYFHERTGHRLEARYGATLNVLVERGLVHWDNRIARLTPRGRMLGNQVFAEFV
jgi:oxygen-independent coproporphyrinogen-3 oxidase